MTLTVTPKTLTFSNGNANDATLVNQAFTDTYGNDSTIASYVNANCALTTTTNTFGSVQTFSAKAVFTSGVNLSESSDPTIPIPGDVWYSATNNVFEGAVQVATVSGATNASPIVITTAAAHGLNSSQTVIIAGVLGNTAANGASAITVLTPTTFSLTGTTGNAGYTSGGTVSIIIATASTLQIQQYPANYHGSATPIATVTNASGTGTVSVTGSSTTITFSTSQSGLTGSYITTAGNQSRVIVSGSTTSWTVNSSFSSTETTVAWKYSKCTGVSLAFIHERDSTNVANIDNTGSCSAILTASAGLGGLDTGSSAANTYYYLYAVSNGVTSGLMFSTVNENVTGSISNSNYAYTYKKQLNFVLLSNAGSLGVPFYIAGGWPSQPIILYDVYFEYWHQTPGPTSVASNTTSSSSFTVLSLASFIPPLSTVAVIYHIGYGSSGQFCSTMIRAHGDTHPGKNIGGPAVMGVYGEFNTDTSQKIEYQDGYDGVAYSLSVAGYVLNLGV